jgi:hypothetical protein
MNEAETRAEPIDPALADLGKPEEIGRLFAWFKKYLYLTDTTT